MATVRVGMAHFGCAKSPDKLETLALGSCVGIVLYDRFAKVGGISHAMLPDVNYAKKSSRGNLAKFVNTGLEQLLGDMIKNGAKKEHIKAKLAGGANMFPEISRESEGHIGKRNTDAAKVQLKALDIPIIAEDIGGSLGRTITLDTTTGKLHVRSIRYGEKEI